MCQMNIIVERDGAEETILEGASLLTVTEQGVEISTLFDAPKAVEGVQVKKIDFMGGKVTLVPHK